MELLISVAAIIVSVILYYAGVRHGRWQEGERREHELRLAREQRTHELALEAARQRREMTSKLADEYVAMVRGHIDSGPHALAMLGLQNLGSDEAIREAIQEMRIRSGGDPWAGQSHHVQGIDLATFFGFVSERRIDFFHTSVEAVASQVRSAGDTSS